MTDSPLIAAGKEKPLKRFRLRAVLVRNGFVCPTCGYRVTKNETATEAAYCDEATKRWRKVRFCRERCAPETISKTDD